MIKANMKSNDILEDGNCLLKKHRILSENLIQIPETREIMFRIDIEENLNIGKPRFKNRYYSWPKDLLKDLRDHLEDIWNYFDKYSHWIDNSLMSLISYTKRKESKKSIIFLLEKDIWETTEVYGDYLIEKREDHSVVSYRRFDKKIISFAINTILDVEIEAWIRKDAIKQIKEQFYYLWTKIETEINICIEEKYHKEPKLLISSIYLIEQLKKTKEIVENWPEASLLNLGRICEMWLLILLDKESSGFNEDSLKLAERNNIIDKDEFKFIKKIRRNYNDLKHKRYYKVDKSLIFSFIIDFSKFFKL
jgi:hypothetical protein